MTRSRLDWVSEENNRNCKRKENDVSQDISQAKRVEGANEAYRAEFECCFFSDTRVEVAREFHGESTCFMCLEIISAFLTQMNRQGPIRGNTTRSRCLSKCFTIGETKKVNSYTERKNKSCNTDKLPKSQCKTKLKKKIKSRLLNKC